MAAVASLEYVMGGWLRSRRLMVPSVGGGPGLWIAPSGRRTGPGDFLLGGGRLAGRGGAEGRPWLHSGGSSPVNLVPLWALFRGDALDGLLPWSSSFWRCH